MKLSYRGIKYETQIPVASTIPGDVIGKYRGVQLRSQNLQEPHTDQR